MTKGRATPAPTTKQTVAATKPPEGIRLQASSAAPQAAADPKRVRTAGPRRRATEGYVRRSSRTRITASSVKAIELARATPLTPKGRNSSAAQTAKVVNPTA